jgi:hypothetical protein
MSIDWTHELVDQLAWHWDHHLRPGIATLTDEEYLWEPVPGWSIRRRGDARTAMATGRDDTVADFEYPEPDPSPFTTIAWRVGHIAIGVLGKRTSAHFGDGSMQYETTDWPLDAAGGLDLLDDCYAAWIDRIRDLDEVGLERPCGDAEGPFAEYPFAALILHLNREVIHHGAEILLLRDLYRNRDALGG